MIQLVFPEGKEKAFTASYDDGTIFDRDLIKLMNEYGIKGTFNLNSSLFGKEGRAVIDGYDTDISRIPEDEIVDLYCNHEIAAHAYTHMKLTESDFGMVSYEIIEDRKNLERLTNRIIKGFAYPFGVYDDNVIQILKNCGINYARTVENTRSFDIPKDFLRWHPTCHHNDAELMNLAKTFCEENNIFGEAQIFYLWGHSYEFSQKNNWQVIENLFKYLHGYRDKIWMASNGEILDYMKRFNNLEYSADGKFVYNPSCEPVWIKNNGEIKKIDSGCTEVL